MILYIFASLLLFLSIFQSLQCESNFNNLPWVKGVTKYISQDSSTHQALLIINQGLFNRNTEIQKIIQEIKPIRPSIHFRVQSGKNVEEIRDVEHLLDLKFVRTTFFIIIDYQNLNIAREAIKLIKTSLRGSFRPKCLVLQFPELTSLDPNEKKFLIDAWINRFLDVTIIQIVGNTSTVHHYNPFTNSFSTRKFTLKTSLFPEKLQNMNGFQLKASCEHFPPDIYIQRNSSGYPISIFGPSLHLFEVFASSMNFKLHIDTIDGKTRTLNDAFDLLFENKNQISLIRSPTTKFCREFCLEYLTTGLGSINALTAKRKNRQINFSLWSFLYSLCPIAVFSGILWLLMYALKRYSNDWNLSFTVQVVLGLTVPQEPEDWKARIIFAYMIILSFVYSSQLYAVLTSINLQSESDSELTTLAELNKSDLLLILDQALISWMETDVQKLEIVRNSLKRFSSPEECAQHAITDRTISCLMPITAASFFQLRFRDEDGNSLINIVEEPFVVAPEGFYLESGSPYAERFHGLLLRLVAFGIFDKLYNNFVPTTSISGMAKEALDDLVIGPNQLLSVLVTILLVGYLVSGIVFIIEIIATKMIRS